MWIISQWSCYLRVPYTPIPVNFLQLSNFPEVSFQSHIPTPGESETKSLAVVLGNSNWSVGLSGHSRKDTRVPAPDPMAATCRLLGPQQVAPTYRVLKTLNEIHLHEYLSQPGRNKSSLSNTWETLFTHLLIRGTWVLTAMDQGFRCASVTKLEGLVNQGTLKVTKFIQKDEVIPWVRAEHSSACN